MLIIKPSKIYISSANVDMRNSIDGLSAIVENKFKLDVFSDAMFLFHNRHCDKIKLGLRVNIWFGSVMNILKELARNYLCFGI